MLEDNLIGLIVKNAAEMPREVAIREKRYGIWHPMTWQEMHAAWVQRCLKPNLSKSSNKRWLTQRNKTKPLSSISKQIAIRVFPATNRGGMFPSPKCPKLTPCKLLQLNIKRRRSWSNIIWISELRGCSEVDLDFVYGCTGVFVNWYISQVQ